MFNDSEFDEAIPQESLDAYARVLVNCGLGNACGINVGDVVLLVCNQFGAEKMAASLQKAVTEAGGHLIFDINMEYDLAHNPDKVLSVYGTTAQVVYYPTQHKEASYKLADHMIHLKSSIYKQVNQNSTKEVSQERKKLYRLDKDMLRLYRDEKWKSSTVAYLPTPQLAEKSESTISELWSVIEDSCYLKDLSSVDIVRDKMRQIRNIIDRLNSLKIKNLQIVGENVDLLVTLHEDSLWRGGNGSNMPSFECYNTPMASKTNGWVNISYPLYFEGENIVGLKLYFTDGRISDWSAEAGSELFAELLKYENFDRLGEVAFTDKDISVIRKPYPSIALLVENVGGTGHIALGNGYPKCIKGEAAAVDRNLSQLHQDIVFNSPFSVIATGYDGAEREIYKDGNFLV